MPARCVDTSQSVIKKRFDAVTGHIRSSSLYLHRLVLL